MLTFLYNPTDGLIHYRQVINPFHNPEEVPRDLALLAGPDGKGIERLGLKEFSVDVDAQPGSHRVEVDESGNIRLRHRQEGEEPGQVLPFRFLAREAHRAQQAPHNRAIHGITNLSDAVDGMRRAITHRILRGRSPEDFVSRAGDRDGSAPSVSVVVPVWNMADVIEDTIESVLTQDVDGGLEIITVDNGSSDESPLILKRLAEGDARIACCRLPLNLGQAAARNLGIDLARGEFISPLDADDVMKPGMVQGLLDAFEPDVDVTHCHVERYDMGMGQRLDDAPWLRRDITPEIIRHKCGCLPSQCLIRRSLFTDRGGWYAEYLQYCEDVEWVLRAVYGCDAIFKRVPRPLLKRRCHPGEDSYGHGVTHHHNTWVAAIRRMYGAGR